MFFLGLGAAPCEGEGLRPAMAYGDGDGEGLCPFGLGVEGFRGYSRWS